MGATGAVDTAREDGGGQYGQERAGVEAKGEQGAM